VAVASVVERLVTLLVNAQRAMVDVVAVEEVVAPVRIYHKL